MDMNEFEIIQRYFTRSVAPEGGVVLGVGDDCALLAPEPGMQLAISSDMLVAGQHFFPDTDPYGLGHKALAVNLSDLAACGARPLAFTLALALPNIDPAWLQRFAAGMLQLADTHHCPLVGGDTTRGPLTISITVLGHVPTGQMLTRSGARPDEDIWVSGTLGDACLALQALQGRITLAPQVLERARVRLERPTPRVALGQALRGIASAALDVSDGLLGDINHLLHASGVGADIAWTHASQLIAASALWTGDRAGFSRDFSLALHRHCILAGGDDYELVFSAPVAQRAAVQEAARCCDVQVSRIGSTRAALGLRLWDAHNQPIDTAAYASFDHFSSAQSSAQ